MASRNPLATSGSDRVEREADIKVVRLFKASGFLLQRRTVNRVDRARRACRSADEETTVRAKRSQGPLILKVNVLQINNEPILAFQEHSLNKARELPKEQWFQTEPETLQV